MKFNFLNTTKTIVLLTTLLFASIVMRARELTPAYDKKAQEKVKRALREMKRGQLKSGKSQKTVTNKKQAIAIGLSEARKAGAKVPRKA
jgi:hypothetical protein